MNRLCVFFSAITLTIALPSTAAAHLVTTGLGSFYDGAMHLLLSPADLLGMVALVMLAGIQGTRTARWSVVTLAAAWLVFGLVGLNLPVAIDLPWLSILCMACLGIMVAVNPKLPSVFVTGAAGFYGALHGLLNGSALALMDAGMVAMIGVFATVLTIGLLCGALIVSLQAAWTLVAVRVAGSWVAAVGMLMLGWLVKGGR